MTLKEQMRDVLKLDEYSDRAAELSAAEEAADAAEEDAADVEDVEDNFDTDEE